MITILIGHRGTGKTTFLSRLRDKKIDAVDLDEAIERESGETVAGLFSKGEAHFREIEKRTFEKLLSEKPDRVIAVGAGFSGTLPKNARVIWLRRETDGQGRSFLNRPRLNSEVTPISEYMERHAEREERFANWATDPLILPEGYEGGMEGFITDSAFKAPFEITVLPAHFRDWENFVKNRIGWEVRRWELRDDLLTPAQIQLALRTLPADRILFSQRRPGGERPEKIKSDWALELGSPTAKFEIVSLHDRQGETLKEIFRTLEQAAAHAKILKLAIDIRDFQELREGHEWWLKDPAKRAFLPRSKDGRWRWYRSLFGPRMPLHFIREDQGSALDQPLLWQAILQAPIRESFAAVLGQPVVQSRTPMEHKNFFARQHMPVVAIELSEDEFGTALPVLRKMGLTHAAVTSPLKKAAYAVSTERTQEARALESANTLWMTDKISAHNTDVLALRSLRAELPEFKSVWLWGGGGVRSSVKEVWPEAVEIRAREGTTREDSPDLLIWAVGRSRDHRKPPKTLKPQLLLDLNYGDDSPGLEWAVENNLPYQSGLKMFKLQAAFQREFWARSRA